VPAYPVRRYSVSNVDPIGQRDHQATVEVPEGRAEERRLLMLGASLWLGGLILGTVAGVFHASPPGGDANNLAATFPGIAASGVWGAVHFGQFAGAWIVLAGLLVLYRAFETPAKRSVLGMLGVAATIAAGSAVAVWLAVDGIALKHAVDAWASAPALEKASAFQDARIVRFLEWSTASYSSLLEGVTFILLGLVIVRTTVLPGWLGWLICVAGLGDIATGIVIGNEGFSPTLTAVSLLSTILAPVVAIGILVIAWRRRHEDATPR
jgi:hypothetical protein